jgi:hypothetical protein
MIIKVTLERRDFETLNEIVNEIIGSTINDNQLQALWDMMPNDVKGTAIQWGMDDTVARDNIYEFLQKDFDEARNKHNG